MKSDFCRCICLYISMQEIDEIINGYSGLAD